MEILIWQIHTLHWLWSLFLNVNLFALPSKANANLMLTNVNWCWFFFFKELSFFNCPTLTLSLFKSYFVFSWKKKCGHRKLLFPCTSQQEVSPSHNLWLWFLFVSVFNTQIGFIPLFIEIFLFYYVTQISEIILDKLISVELNSTIYFCFPALLELKRTLFFTMRFSKMSNINRY